MYFKLFSLLLIISVPKFTIHALPEESLVNGDKAEEGMFTYQVAIMGKKNFTNDLRFVCSGAILTETIVLTAAQCFVNEAGYHRELSFLILAGKINVYAPEGWEIGIKYIYLAYVGSFYSNNIALAQLTKEIGIYAHYPHLTNINYANIGETFWDQEGIIAGYGYHFMNIHRNPNPPAYFNAPLVAYGQTDFSLRYAPILIKQDDSCGQGQLYANFRKQLCGFTYPRYQGQKVGLCKYDAGSPLVVNNKVVGVANTHHFDCNDVEIGGLYTSVATYSDFINGILFNDPLATTIVYRNRIHFAPFHVK